MQKNSKLRKKIIFSLSHGERVRELWRLHKKQMKNLKRKINSFPERKFKFALKKEKKEEKSKARRRAWME